MGKGNHLKYYSVVISILVILGFISLLFFLATPFVVHLITSFFPTTQISGQFGDQFGALNALFSGLGLCLVAATLFLQTHELRLQRDENQETQAILDQQHRQLHLQSQTASRQAFEDTFFSLLAVLKASQVEDDSIRKILDAHIGKPYGVVWESGDDQSLPDGLAREIRQVHLSFTLVNVATAKVDEVRVERRLRAASVFAASWPRIREDLRYYIRNLEIVLIHIGRAHLGLDSIKIDRDTAMRWADVVKSTLSRRELALVAMASDLSQFKDLCYYARLFHIYEDYISFLGIDDYIQEFDFKIGRPVESLQLAHRE